MPNISKPSVILLSIGGTLSDRHFFSRGLLPFMRTNVGHFLRETAHCKSTTRKMINRLRSAQKRLQTGGDDEASSWESANSQQTIKGVQIELQSIPAIDEEGGSDSSVSDVLVEACVDFHQWLTEQRPTSVELKELRLLMWVWAIENRLQRSHVFKEVSDTLHQWTHKEKIRICLYSQCKCVPNEG